MPIGKKGFQPGNKVQAKKPRLFTDALMMELKAAGEDMPELRMIARKTIELAKDGNVQAREELSTRLEGKVAQAVIGSDEDPINLVHTIVRKIVEP